MDLRKLDRESRERLRVECVDAAIQGKETHEQIAERYQIPRETVSRWVSTFRRKGKDGLKSRIPKGKKPALDAKQRKRLIALLEKYTPSGLNISDSELWTREFVAEVIYREFGLKLGLTTVGDHLRRMGFSFQKPIRNAYEQNPDAVKRWLEVEYPTIRKEAADSRASIYFADEAGVRSDHQSGQTWARRGKTPVVPATGKRFRVNAISAISRQGSIRYMVFAGKLNSKTFIEFLKRLMSKRRRPVTLILDGSSVHKSKAVSSFVHSLKGKLKIYFLPAYSPELNPDELVWNNLKNHGINRRRIESKKSLQKMVSGHLRKLMRKPQIVAGFFFKESTKYAS